MQRCLSSAANNFVNTTHKNVSLLLAITIMIIRQTGALMTGYKPLILANASRRWLSLCSSPEPLSLWLPLEGFFILARTQLVPHYVMLFLLTDVITNRHFIESNCTHKAPFGPKLPVVEFVFQVCMIIENYQRAFTFRVPHEA